MLTIKNFDNIKEIGLIDGWEIYDVTESPTHYEFVLQRWDCVMAKKHSTGWMRVYLQRIVDIHSKYSLSVYGVSTPTKNYFKIGIEAFKDIKSAIATFNDVIKLC